MKYRKKPVVIEAEQYKTWDDGKRMGLLCDGFGVHYIETLEGRLFPSKGDWIITGIKGEKYPCKPDVFEKTYDPA